MEDLNLGSKNITQVGGFLDFRNSMTSAIAINAIIGTKEIDEKDNFQILGELNSCIQDLDGISEGNSIIQEEIIELRQLVESLYDIRIPSVRPSTTTINDKFGNDSVEGRLGMVYRTELDRVSTDFRSILIKLLDSVKTSFWIYSLGKVSDKAVDVEGVKKSLESLSRQLDSLSKFEGVVSVFAIQE